MHFKRINNLVLLPLFFGKAVFLFDVFADGSSKARTRTCGFASAAQRNIAAVTVNFYKNPLRVLSGGIYVLLLIIIKEISLK